MSIMGQKWQPDCCVNLLQHMQQCQALFYLLPVLSSLILS